MGGCTEDEEGDNNEDEYEGRKKDHRDKKQVEPNRSAEYKDKKNGKRDDMAATGSSSVTLRVYTRRRKSNTEKEENNMSVVDNKNKKCGRKRKIISGSKENEAAQEEENGRVIKIAKKDLVNPNSFACHQCRQKNKNEVLSCQTCKHKGFCTSCISKCDNCKTSLFACYRHCRTCNFDLCLVCCRELRGKQLQGGADPIELKFIFYGNDYYHGGYKNKDVKEVESQATAELEHKWSRFDWHEDSDGRIRCPITECENSFLELRSLYPPSHIADLVCKAERLVTECKLMDVDETHNNLCSCLNLDTNTDDIYNKRKAGFREDSSDNCLYCPKAKDLHPNGTVEKGSL